MAAKPVATGTLGLCTESAQFYDDPRFQVVVKQSPPNFAHWTPMAKRLTLRSFTTLQLNSDFWSFFMWIIRGKLVSFWKKIYDFPCLNVGFLSLLKFLHSYSCTSQNKLFEWVEKILQSALTWCTVDWILFFRIIFFVERGPVTKFKRRWCKSTEPCICWTRLALDQHAL